MEFEPLRPNLNEDPALQEKRAKAAKLKAYSKELDRLNKMALAKQPKYQSPSPPPKQPTRLDKARVYAQTIPAPRQKPRRGRGNDRGGGRAGAGACFRVGRTGVYASDDDGDDGDLYKPTRLEVLELQHDQRRAAAAEIRGAYGFSGRYLGRVLGQLVRPIRASFAVMFRREYPARPPPLLPGESLAGGLISRRQGATQCSRSLTSSVVQARPGPARLGTPPPVPWRPPSSPFARRAL